ncbi:MAG: EAL domain-containing protein, partial [Devosiaceae bacterium]|nr:EAL domain-containing protein [Devosiaceae bacterium]
ESKGKMKECVALLDEVFEGKKIHDVQRKRLHKDGSLVDVSISAAPMFDENGDVYGATYSAEDISERLKAQEKLNQLAYFDQLTGLPNNACLQKDLAEHLNKGEELTPLPISLAIIELSGFREVNDTLGILSGNKLIKEVTKRLDEVANGAKIYRSNIYEFYITMAQCGDPIKIMSTVQAIIRYLRKPFEIDNQRVHLGAKAGVSIAPLHGQNVEELLANTSLALCAAKCDNDRCARFFSMSIRTSAQSRRELDLDLRRAFQAKEFELFYQPQINLLSGKIIGAEALLRWRHPDHGIIPPGGFIDALAKNPIAYEVGKWIMREAIEKAANWRLMGLGDIRIGVNLFGAQFEHDLVEDVEDALTDFALPANLFELEITENIAIGFKKNVIDPLRKIKNMGVSIAFDDFGTGYASLSYLLKYPLTRIKIDRSFLFNIPKSAEEAAIVRAIIAMSHGLGLEVITEGVETKQHVSFLKIENCEEAQGFYYAKPLPEDQFIEFVKSDLIFDRSTCANIAI